LKEKLQTAFNEAAELKKRHAELKTDLENLQERFAFGKIEETIYRKFSLKTKSGIAELEKQIADCAFSSSNLDLAVEKAFAIAENISKTWHDSDFDGKQMLQNLVYPKGIRYNKQNDTARTEKINSLFEEISILSGILAEKEKGNRSTDCLLSSYVPRTGFEPARPLRTPPPQSGLSTNFNTWAGKFEI
jgi:site-specific DNA recombinase